MQRLIIFILLGIIFSPVLAENKNNPIPSSHTLSLKQAQEIALKNHPEIASSIYRNKADEQAVKVARSHYLPQVNAAVVGVATNHDNLVRITAAEEGIRATNDPGRVSYGVTVHQLITDFGRTGHLVGSAEASLMAQAARSLSVRDQVLYAVTRAYYNVLRAKQILQVAEKTLKSRQLLFDQIKELFDVKMKSELDVNIAGQSVDEANLLLIKAQNDLDSSQAELSQALGFGEEKQFVLVSHTKIEPFLIKIESLLKQAKTNNPELVALRAELDAANKRYLAEKAANYPHVKGFGYAGENPARNGTAITANYAVAGINVSVPIYTGGRLTAAENQAKYLKRAVKNDLLNKENQIIRDVKLVSNNVDTTYKNIKSTEELYKNTVKTLELTQERYNVGKSSIVDLSLAQLNEMQTEIAYVNAGYDYLINRALLEFYLGTGLNSKN